MEYMNMGDLHSYLIKNNKLIENKEAMLKQFLSILIQIANGCLYLEEENIVHRDLAARNCLLHQANVDEKLIVKISDLGLARNMYTDQRYEIKSKNALPLRWMSPESVIFGYFTSKSDVWSFAILTCACMSKRNRFSILRFCDFKNFFFFFQIDLILRFCDFNFLHLN